MSDSRFEIIRRVLRNAEPGRDVQPAMDALDAVAKDMKRWRDIEKAAQAYVDQPDPDKVQGLLEALDAEV